MRVADMVAEKCKSLNEHTFLFVGGGNMYLADALSKANCYYIAMHHEQALAMAAESYARYTGKPSVCIVTTGPGGINALNGVAGAYLDSIPMVIISGQVRTPLMKELQRQVGDQEVPIVDIVKPITKFATVIKDPDQVFYQFDKAVHIATSGRPGPVWLDIPLDVQAATCYPDEVDKYYSVDKKVCVPKFSFETAMGHLEEAKRPLILAGNGIRIAGAANYFLDMITETNIPVAWATNAMDLLPTSHPCNLGVFGLCGHQVTNDIIQEADVILILGCRMNLRQTGYDFGVIGKDAIKIMVDIDINEFKKINFNADIKVLGDVKDFISRMLLTKRHDDWVGPRTATQLLSPVIKEILNISEKMANRRNVIVSSNGTIPTYLNRYLYMREGDRYIVNSGLGSMGYGLPAAIGAAIASKERVICFEGEGSLQLNIQELQTMKHLGLPIKLIVVNNGGYASIKATQDAYFNGNYVARGIESGISFPDLESIAAAYKLPYYKGVDTWNSLDSPGPAIFEIEVTDEVPYKAGYATS